MFMVRDCEWYTETRMESIPVIASICWSNQGKGDGTESTIHSSESLDYEQLNRSVEPNTDIGFDIGRVKSSKTIGECCDVCRSNISCSFWTFFNSNSSCY